MPPRRADIFAAVRESLRELSSRCRMHDFDMLVEDITAETCQELLTLLDKRSNSHPIEWSEITRAKRFLQGLYVQYLDHNSSAIGAFCPALVRHFAHKLLDFGVHATSTKFT